MKSRVYSQLHTKTYCLRNVYEQNGHRLKTFFCKRINKFPWECLFPWIRLLKKLIATQERSSLDSILSHLNITYSVPSYSSFISTLILSYCLFLSPSQFSSKLLYAFLMLLVRDAYEQAQFWLFHALYKFILTYKQLHYKTFSFGTDLVFHEL